MVMSYIKAQACVLAWLLALLLGAVPAGAQNGVVDATADAVAQLNALRAQHGRAAVTPNDKLTQMATNHARDMVQNGFFSHTSSNGAKIKQRSRAVGYRYCAVNENLAKGSGTIAELIEQWMGSPGHRKNLLSRKVREFGLARGPDKLWVMVMARRC